MKNWPQITPWSETVISVIVGVGLLLMKKTELAQVTLVIGPALSITRYYITKKIDEEMESVRSLASIVDIHQRGTTELIHEISRIYFEITEPEFVGVKNTVLSETRDKLLRLAHQKTSDELPTGDYYNWLLPMLQAAKDGSEIWAVSMMLDCEWDDSPAEEQFLELNIQASRRGVVLERIFVVSRGYIPAIAGNRGVKVHLENAGKTLRPLIVEREWLVNRDPALLKDLGDGLIAFDRRVALIDTLSAQGIRGRVTMNPGEITRLRKVYDNLRVNARDLRAGTTSRNSGGHPVASVHGMKPLPSAGASPSSGKTAIDPGSVSPPPAPDS